MENFYVCVCVWGKKKWVCLMCECSLFTGVVHRLRWKLGGMDGFLGNEKEAILRSKLECNKGGDET